MRFFDGASSRRGRGERVQALLAHPFTTPEAGSKSRRGRIA
jgi:hypothetical protein